MLCDKLVNGKNKYKQITTFLCRVSKDLSLYQEVQGRGLPAGHASLSYDTHKPLANGHNEQFKDKNSVRCLFSD